MNQKPRPLSWFLVLCAATLTALGVLMVASAGKGSTGDLQFGSKQAVFAAVGFLVLFAISSIDYRALRRLNVYQLGASLLSLVAVLSPLGTEVRGTRGWFRFAGLSVQPSEFAKLSLIVALAVLFSGVSSALDSDTWDSSTQSIGRRAVPSAVGTGRFIAGLVVVSVFCGAVLAQGEAGTVTIFGAIAAVMFVVAGVSGRHLLLVCASAVGLGFFALQANLLAPYQVDRLRAFLDADLDPQGVGYNQHQALTAIGSGGLEGAGLFNGPQTQLGYLPDQHTDFIFAAVAEELGLFGALLVLALEAVTLSLVFRIGVQTRDQFGSLLCTGVFAMLAFQLLQNTAMNLRLAPIMGIPLPFMSYGGSSLVTSLAALGLALSVDRHPNRRSRPVKLVGARRHLMAAGTTTARQARIRSLTVIGPSPDRLDQQ